MQIRAAVPLHPAHSDTGASAASAPEPGHAPPKQYTKMSPFGVFDPNHVLRAVVAGMGLKQQRGFAQSLHDMMAFVTGARTQDAVASKGLDVPSRQVLTKARRRMDTAAMLANRELYSIRGRLFRYLAADASPQADQSVEVFVTVERTILRSEVTGKAMSSITSEAFTERLMPICTLGHCRTDLASKVITQALDINCKNLLSLYIFISLC